MKKILSLLVMMVMSITAFAQTDGLYKGQLNYELLVGSEVKKLEFQRAPSSWRSALMATITWRLRAATSQSRDTTTGTKSHATTLREKWTRTVLQ